MASATLPSNVCFVCWNLEHQYADPTFAGSFMSKEDDDVWFDITQEEILLSIDTGCPYCRLLFQIAREYDGLRGPSGDLSVHIHGKHVMLQCFQAVVNKASVELFVIEGAPTAWPHISVRNTIDPDPTSTTSFRFIKDSINTCTKNHSACQQRETYLPRRLVQIVDDRIQLVETTPLATGLYVAYSYCWGRGKFVTTKSTNIESMKQGLAISTLPASFRDVILVTSRLGLEYIWIDSLCIIQDSKEDWDIESAKMARIYEDAFLTIAASSSASVGDSFLHPREGSDMRTFPFVREDGTATTVHARRMLRCGSHHNFEPADPWDLRAWTFQEKLLSTRLISFSRQELQWFCKAGRNCECKGEHPFRLAGAASASYSALDRQDVFKLWRIHVSEYTRRHITYHRDRLPALSGIAKVVHDRTGSEFLAGLWLENLIMELCWSRGWSEEWEPQRGLPDCYVAPSFSWASTVGTVAQVYMDGPYPQDWSEMTRVVSTATNLAGSNPFGVVEACSVVLRGPVVSGFISSKNDQPQQQKLNYKLSLRGLEGTLKADTVLEEFRVKPGPGQASRSTRRSSLKISKQPLLVASPIVALYLASYKSPYEESDKTRIYLVLGLTDQEGCYQRLGLSTWPGADTDEDQTEDAWVGTKETLEIL